jgi:D-sedoheptulose 7-phosphate isomerase
MDDEKTMRNRVGLYFATLSRLILETEVTDGSGRPVPLEEAFDKVGSAAHSVHDAGNKIMFIGNGGSAGLASHLAIDFCKNGGLRSLAFNDASALTCLGNDLGYHNVFAKQLEFHARAGDLLIAISSSGQSANILAAVAAARTAKVGVITFSGFGRDNELRRSGDLNFYVRSNEYGFVEVAHLSLCHSILDLDMGWGATLQAARLAVS